MRDAEQMPPISQSHRMFPEMGPFITESQAVKWTDQHYRRLLDLLEREVVIGFRYPIRYCERSLGEHFGLELPGPRERELAAKPPPLPPPSVSSARRDVGHWLYWFYDADGALLYIGITNAGVKRMEQHGADKLWWPLVAAIAVDHFPNRDEAERAELAAIREHGPLHNGTHNPKRGCA